MKAVIWEKYAGPESQVLKEVQKPIPKDGQVIVRIYATSVNAGDCETRELRLPLLLGLPVRLFIGFRKPKRIKILGQDFAGEVEDLGSKTSALKAGDKIFGATGFLMGEHMHSMLQSMKSKVTVYGPIYPKD